MQLHVYGTDVGLDQVDLAEILMVAIYTYLQYYLLKCIYRHRNDSTIVQGKLSHHSTEYTCTSHDHNHHARACQFCKGGGLSIQPQHGECSVQFLYSALEINLTLLIKVVF